MTDAAKSNRYSTADALLAAMHKAGVTHIFGNLGSDHAGIIESLARASGEGRQVFELILCPHEGVALAAAHGHAQVSGQAQAVFVHVDVGTQNMGGAISNASHGRVPVFIFAGLTPYTLEGELPGSRNRAATYLQDVANQGGIIRQYVKWDYDIRTGKNVEQLVLRAIQIAQSEPKGPVYLTGAREVLEEDAKVYEGSVEKWRPIEPTALSPAAIEEILAALTMAERPMILTSYSGRNQASVAELVRLAERLGVPVVEERPIHMNFPADNKLHWGYQAETLIGEPDVLVIIDCDVPWVASTGQVPNEDARIFYIDTDPLKDRGIQLWYMPSERFYQADSHLALIQLNEALEKYRPLPAEKLAARMARAEARHTEMRQKWAKGRVQPADDNLTPNWVATCLYEAIDDDTILINESITSGSAVFQNNPRTKPGTFFGSGGSSLGWGGGAALGTKLAAPDKLVVCLTGDGSYFLGNPSSVYWASRKYAAPFLTIIFNNQGWNATRENFKRIHAGGGKPLQIAECISLGPPADLADVAAAAGGALAITVSSAAELPALMKQAVAAVRAGRSAVIDARMVAIS